MPEIPALGYKAFKVIKKEMKEEIILAYSGSIDY
jgi:hypothetical protein